MLRTLESECVLYLPLAGADSSSVQRNEYDSASQSVITATSGGCVITDESGIAVGLPILNKVPYVTSSVFRLYADSSNTVGVSSINNTGWFGSIGALYIPIGRNCIYRGWKESPKFLLLQQGINSLTQAELASLSPVDSLLSKSEDLSYPDDTSISTIQHTNLQLRFREWIRLRKTDSRWFI